MRPVLISAAALVAGGLACSLGPDSATAAPLPAMSTPSAELGTVQTIGWRDRYYRRTGVWPTGPRSNPVPADVVIAPDGTAVVVAPLRPLSCGEYRYWNGMACVDARYNDPYLGPR